MQQLADRQIGLSDSRQSIGQELGWPQGQRRDHSVTVGKPGRQLLHRIGWHGQAPSLNRGQLRYHRPWGRLQSLQRLACPLAVQPQ